ncbi:MAG: RNA polymerase-binding ATPase [Verrucomicrobia bacterium]|nr:MAG: RNA polymerase-binding ATPase [Verrucomicrobiota bacterium]TAE88479.1 MAG: RNA polymerase-binding ATPase [Verrucomicrobiota bacterium]TAF26934.1 MAG: RNA polymerase-binding ATPase [Verrucomicrobiota bacterium]TAF42191.1 MAG: RNA polymerase-binding ATPase [Verrucomicrobiota bacterium]
MPNNTWTRGQRWVSDSEPELGLGIILSGGEGRVEIVFPAAGENRCYALDSAPLRRVKFLPGDRIKTHEGVELTVAKVREEAGLRIYETEDGEVAEAQLSDSMSFSKPEERLFGGKLDDPGDFDLRGESLRRRAAMRRSPARGLAGARVDLIPHQLFIADEVARRPRPRVLLADEVGLGKTIEACLIVQRLLLTGRAARVLVLVPEPLVHQWFVELLRRFNLSFDLFDEDRCSAIEEEDPEANPFLERQWVLAAVDFLASDARRAAQAVDAGWDLLVVDEAHHLEWSPDAPGTSYEMVRTLAETTAGVLLLTATPQQLGPEGHFARLRLLDPERYGDLTTYLEETKRYEEVAELVERLAQGETPDEGLESIVAGRRRLERALQDFRDDRPEARESLLRDLLDSCGIGRVMFRNTRARLGGFPERLPLLVPLTGKKEVPAKVKWLAGLLENLPPEEKVLVIARSRELAEEIMESLRDTSGWVAALFHEELTLLQRDRNAAFFAEEDGARVLLCSEIGSEGRNFQFARHLVLFDLPEDIDLLEQRIGRLDRIGQRGTIQIHVPYLKDSDEETRVRWVNEGLDAFRASPPGAAEIQRAVAPLLRGALAKRDASDALITATRKCRTRISERLTRGRDRLLERASHRPEASARIVGEIRAWDEDAEFEDFLLRLFEHCGLHIEELGRRRYFLLPGNLKSDAFPSLPNEGVTATLDRQRALEREHEAFLTWDHPMVRAALDLQLGSESGNAAFGLWESPGGKRMLLEAWLVVECVAPAHLHIERFLPQTPLRVAVDHAGGDQSGDSALATAKLRRGDPSGLLRNESVKRKVLPLMLDRARELGLAASRGMIGDAHDQMHAEMSSEIARLKDLAEINDHVRPDEIATLENRERELAEAIRGARVRIDAVRLVWKAPAT